MRRTHAGAVVAVLVALGCSACGSTHAVTHFATTTTTASTTTTLAANVVPFALPQAANLVILPPQRGVGDEQLGTFTAAGDVYVELSCKGKGFLTIVRISSSGPCDGGNPVGIEVPGEEGKPVPLVVRAEPGTTWRLAVGEHIPGATLVLVHSSGSGNSKSFGPFERRGTITVANSCRGRGDLDVVVTTTSPPHGDGVSAVCPITPGGTMGPLRPVGRRFTIDVHAGPHVRWAVTVREAIPK